MKYLKLYISLLTFSLLLSACEKYLDVKKVSTNTFIETADDCQKILDTYSVMNVNYPSDGQASSDDYYLGTNSFPGSFTQENKDVYTWQPSAIHQQANPQWLSPYSVVYRANLVLEVLEQDKVKKTADAGTINNLKGAALFFRAYALWHVAQLYAKPYGVTAAQDQGIPARTSSDLNDAVGRGTVQQTYDRIVQDLKEATALLNETSSVATRPNKASAYAMLARVYLSMEDYEQALTAATQSMSLKKDLLEYNTLSTTSSAPFSIFNTEVLFQSSISRINTTEGTSTGDLLLFPGQATNPQALINIDLYNSYDNNDLRKAIFFKQNTGIYAGTYRFTGAYSGTTAADLFNGLTVDEVYLIRAECYARTGKTLEALKDLNDLLVTRFKKVLVAGELTTTYVPYSTTDADVALSYIINERRKELVMRGQRWTDLRRLNKDARFKTDIVRQENGTGTVLATLLANDPRYVLLIPQQVISNSNGIVQQTVR